MGRPADSSLTLQGRRQRVLQRADQNTERARAGRDRKSRPPRVLPRVHVVCRHHRGAANRRPLHRPDQLDRDADPVDGGRLLLIAPRPVRQRARQPRVDESVSVVGSLEDVPAALPAAADDVLERLRDLLLSLHPQLGADRHTAAAACVGRDACDRVRSARGRLGMSAAWGAGLLPGSR